MGMVIVMVVGRRIARGYYLRLVRNRVTVR